MSKPIEAAGRMFVIEGLEEAKAKLRELDPKKMRAAERTALRAAAGLIATAAKRRAPRATGMLATKKIRVGASVTTEQGLTGSHSVLVATVGTNRVGMFQEFGTAAHIIRGRRGRVLKFGGWFVRSVRHPRSEEHTSELQSH